MSDEPHTGVIHRLSDDLANQIAAGEVVERPASALKELVENALDAHADRIEIELEDGGLGLIRVVDNGVGMTPEDARLCIERHATSKLTSREQLFHIETLGFRGEAIPSIASVSRFEILTKPHGTLGGTRVRIEGGALLGVDSAGAPPGTSITVRNLFYNTPARLKFLKTRQTELKHAMETVHRLALANPAVHFRLRHNGRELVELPSVTDLKDRIYMLFGREEADKLHPLQPAEQDAVHASGFFGEPSLSRRTTAGIWTFVNGRFVRDRTIMGAIRVAYQGLIDRGRHPVVVLFLKAPPDLIDVNVHPMKTEVRFHDTSALFRAARRAIHQSLAAAPWVPDAADLSNASSLLGSGTFGAHSARPAPPEDRTGDLPFAGAPQRVYTLRSNEPDDASALDPASESDTHEGASSYATETGLAEDPGSTRRPDQAPGASRLAGGARVAPRAMRPFSSSGERGGPSSGMRGPSSSIAAPEAPPRAGYFSSLHYIGAFRGTYLLNSDGIGLVIVDQHAAHERITFEMLRSAWSEREIDVQPLLFAERIQFDSLRAAMLADNIEFFARVGFEIEPFGGGDFALKAVPAILSSARHRALLEDALDDLADQGESMRLDEAIEAILSRMACHGSVRAGDVLQREEVTKLYEEMDRIDFGANCPHGRPVYFRLGLDEIEKRFDRR